MLELAATYAPKGNGIEWLLNYTDIHVDDEGSLGRSAFLDAVYKGNLPLMKLLRENGANVNMVDNRGYTALQLAIKKGVAAEIVEWLIDARRYGV